MALELMIISSEDEESLGLVSYVGDLLTIGNSIKSTLFIKDDQMMPVHALIESRNRCLLRSVDSFILLNNIKIEGEIELQVGDNILLGSTLIKLKSFTPSIPKKDKILEARGKSKLIYDRLAKLVTIQ